MGVYLWGGSFNERYRFVNVKLHLDKLWVNLVKDEKTGKYVSGCSVTDREVLIPFSELKGKIVKHKVYGCVGRVSQFCTVSTNHKTDISTPKSKCFDEYVFVRWIPFGKKGLLMSGWVNINDVEF